MKLKELASRFQTANGCQVRTSGIKDADLALVRALVDIGLLRCGEDGVGLHQDVPIDTFDLFAGLIDRVRPNLRGFSVGDGVVRMCTALFDAETPNIHGLDLQKVRMVSGGQGLTKAQAALSCLGEMAERLSLLSSGIGDPRVYPVRKGMPDLSVAAILGYSDRQQSEIGATVGASTGSASDALIDWNGVSDRRVEVTNLLDGSVAQIPAMGALFGEARVSGLAMSTLASTLGAAVWGQFAEAERRAVLELIERDAFAQAWYNRLGITLLPETVLPTILPKKIHNLLVRRPRVTRLFDVATDLNAHVLAAISHDENGFQATLGVAAGLETSSVALSAVTEMLQNEISLSLAERAAKSTDGGGEPSAAVVYARKTCILDDLGLDNVAVADRARLSIRFSYEQLLDGCRDRDIDLWRFDATHPAVGIPCVKVMSSALCDWQPRFGKVRLFDGVVSCGLRARPATEDEFAARPFPF